MVHNKNFPKCSTNIATNNYFQKTKSQTAKRSLFETSIYNTTKNAAKQSISETSTLSLCTKIKTE